MEKEKGREREGKEEEEEEREFQVGVTSQAGGAVFPLSTWERAGPVILVRTSRIRSWTDTQDTLSPVAAWQGQCCTSPLQFSIQLSFTALYTRRTAYCPPVPGWSLTPV